MTSATFELHVLTNGATCPILSSYATNPMTTATIKASAFEFAQAQGMTKQQAISFTICAIHAKGFSVKQAFEEVVGNWDMVAGSSDAEIMAAVRASF